MRPAPLVLLLFGCAARRPVDVTIVSAHLGPGKHTGEVWDGLGSVPPEARQAAAAALAQMDPALGLGAMFAEQWMRAVEAPDAVGSVFASGPAGGLVTELALPEQPDTFTPDWSGLRLAEVPLASDTTVGLRLADADVLEHDFIGECTLDGRVLRRALRARKPYTVDVSDQTDGQVLTVTISVDRATK